MNNVAASIAVLCVLCHGCVSVESEELESMADDVSSIRGRLDELDRSVYRDMHRRLHRTWGVRVEHVLPEGELRVVTDSLMGEKDAQTAASQLPRLKVLGQWVRVCNAQLDSSIGGRIRAQARAYVEHITGDEVGKRFNLSPEELALVNDPHIKRLADITQFDVELGKRIQANKDEWLRWAEGEVGEPPEFYEALVCGLVLHSYGAKGEVKSMLAPIEGGYELTIGPFDFQDNVWLGVADSVLAATLGFEFETLLLPRYPIGYALLGVREEISLNPTGPLGGPSFSVVLTQPSDEPKDRALTWRAYVCSDGIVISEAAIFAVHGTAATASTGNSSRSTHESEGD